jgi:hypothetical protein
MLTEPSTLSQEWENTDISISSTTETWQSRPETEEEPKNGTSINNP